ncbi:MAG: hypothetical protein ACFFAH_01450 [Promethearchaeota archaeon]
MVLLCCYCGSEITWKRKRRVHINICQKPSILHFCNQACKLNWIFWKSDLKHEKNINGNWIKEEVENIFDMAVVDDKTDELEIYLKKNNLRILREA